MIFFLFGVLTGSINGNVIDEDGKPLPYVNVIVRGTEFGTATGENGEFSINNVPVGIHEVEFSMIGYKTRVISNVYVKSHRTYSIDVQLFPSVIRTKTVKVVASYFRSMSANSVSEMEFSNREIKDMPGVTGDVSRMIQTMTGVSIPSDDRNDIVVRGGSPDENLYLLDGIKLPTLSLFSSLGSTGGTIGIIDPDFVKKLSFYAGGYDATYPNALSSVINLKTRDGSYDNNVYAFDLSMGGLGLNLDGHINRLSYLISFKKSFLDILSKLGVFDLAGIPEYYTFHTKLSYKLNKRDRIFTHIVRADSWIDISGWEGMDVYDRFGMDIFSIGLNKYVFLSRMELSFAYINPKYGLDIETKKNNYMFAFINNSKEPYFQLSSRITIPVSIFNLNAGATYFYRDIYHYLAFKEDSTGNTNIPLDTLVSKTGNTFDTEMYTSVSMRLRGFRPNFGINATYFDYTSQLSFSPTVSLSYDIADRLKLKFGWGWYHEHPQMIWLTANDANSSLKDMSCIHYITGFEYLLREDTRLSIDGYIKYYSDYPVDKEDSMRILLNEGGSYEGFINFDTLVSEGLGTVKGIDITLQKKLSKGFFANITYSFNNTAFVPLSKDTVHSIYAPGHILRLTTSFSLPKGFSLGGKFAWSSGRYYYPIDSLKSVSAGYPVRDYSNLEKYPDYHRLDLRLSKKDFYKYFSIESYWELQNVYNRENIREYIWDSDSLKIKPTYQWGFMFVGGFRIEF